MTERKYNGSSTNRATNLYGANGSIAQTVDYSVGTRTQFTYDLADRLVSRKDYATTAKNGGTLRSSTDYTYADKTNYLTGIKHFSPLGTQNIGYTYGNIGIGQMPDQIYKVSWNGQEKVNYTYDSLGRLTNKSVIVGGGVPDAPRLNTRYTYVNVGENKTTTLVNSVQTAAGTFTYTYDEVGNIKTVSDGTYTTSYVYDNLNQLVRENNQQIGKTYTYAYQNGNITERKEYAYTTGALPEQPQCVYSWSYDDDTWGDLLTDFNGIQITYDEIGNPTAIGEAALSWDGRQLKQVVDGGSTYSYAYNIDGQRVSKTVTKPNGTVTTTEYFYNGEILAGQKTGDDTLVFMYDNDGTAFGFTYNGTEYYYLKNKQGDVDAVVDSNRQIVAKYAYDAWGKVISVTDADGVEITDNTHIGHINPIRYRGYYYDQESNFYYLNSRYYAPDICRFLNADGYASTGQGLLGNNMFAYCMDNPVNFYDPSGSFTAIFPAEGDGPMIIIPEKGEPDLTVSHEGNTYTIEVHSGTGSENRVAPIINAINGEVLTRIAEEAIQGLGGIQYRNYVTVTFSNACGAILKNIGRAGNNALYTALSPYLNDMRTVGKGIVAMAAFAFDVFLDYCTYGANPTDFNKAVIVTGATTIACLAFGFFLPETVMGLTLGIAFGVTANVLSTQIKKEWIGY